jgi:hypothetical protein
MESSITRIADLPVNPQSTNMYSSDIPPTAVSISGQKSGKLDSDVPTNYMPMNIHPNPYGVSAQNPIMETGQATNMQRMDEPRRDAPPHMAAEHMQALAEMGHQRLPSRDIARDTAQYSHDEQVQPNYIPRANHPTDYVRDHYELTEKRLQEHEYRKRKESRLDMILTEIQVPVLIAVLFFLYQLPAINTLIFKRFSFLSLYDVDGNFNLAGLLLKSILFGSTYYFLRSITNWLSEL